VPAAGGGSDGLNVSTPLADRSNCGSGGPATAAQRLAQLERPALSPMSPFGHGGACALLDLSRGGPGALGAAGDRPGSDPFQAVSLTALTPNVVHPASTSAGAPLSSALGLRWGSKRRRTSGGQAPSAPASAAPVRSGLSPTRPAAARPVGGHDTATSPQRPRAQRRDRELPRVLAASVSASQPSRTRDRLVAGLLSTGALGARGAEAVRACDALTDTQRGAGFGQYAGIMSEFALGQAAVFESTLRRVRAALAEMDARAAQGAGTAVDGLLSGTYARWRPVLERELGQLERGVAAADAIAPLALVDAGRLVGAAAGDVPLAARDAWLAATDALRVLSATYEGAVGRENVPPAVAVGAAAAPGEEGARAADATPDAAPTAGEEGPGPAGAEAPASAGAADATPAEEPTRADEGAGATGRGEAPGGSGTGRPTEAGWDPQATVPLGAGAAGKAAKPGPTPDDLLRKRLSFGVHSPFAPQPGNLAGGGHPGAGPSPQ